LFLASLCNSGEPIELCGSPNNTCMFARNFSMQFVSWISKDSIAVTHLKYSNNHTGNEFNFMNVLLQEFFILKIIRNSHIDVQHPTN
jgi:hypothetical protein